MHDGYVTALAFAFVLGLFVGGCGRSADDREPLAHTGLKEIANLLKDHVQQKKRAPARFADLQPFAPAYPGAIKALETGECVLIYGVRFASSAEATKTVLAYEKKTPQEGGAVLMLDGTLRQMTSEEFRAAPKAKSS